MDLYGVRINPDMFGVNVSPKADRQVIIPAEVLCIPEGQWYTRADIPPPRPMTAAIRWELIQDTKVGAPVSDALVLDGTALISVRYSSTFILEAKRCIKLKSQSLLVRSRSKDAYWVSLRLCLLNIG